VRGFFEQTGAAILKVTHSGTQRGGGRWTVIEEAASRYRLLRAEALQTALDEARAKAATEPNPAPPSTDWRLEASQGSTRCARQARQDHGKDPRTVSIHPRKAMRWWNRERPTLCRFVQAVGIAHSSA